MKKRIRICEAEFRRLWAAGASRLDLAERFGCSLSWIDNYRMALAIPARNRANPQECFSPFDPTPEEIAERARECREKHYAERRGETDVATRSKTWRDGVTENRVSQ